MKLLLCFLCVCPFVFSFDGLVLCRCLLLACQLLLLCRSAVLFLYDFALITSICVCGVCTLAHLYWFADVVVLLALV